MEKFQVVLRRNYLVALVIFAALSSASKAFSQGSYSGLEYANFKVDEFSYLNITSLSSQLVEHDDDCGFACLEIPPCFSYNLAARPDIKGKMLCELLPTDKYNNSDKFVHSRLFHHFSIPSSCSSYPCKNKGKCVSLYEENSYVCVCKEGFAGKNCETIKLKSCNELYGPNKSNETRVVTLNLDSKPVSVLCHMGDFGCGDGGWTPVIKINGNKRTFHYDSKLWSNNKTFNPAGGWTGFDNSETKLPTYWSTSFSKICLGMKIGQQMKFVVINETASSLYLLIADGQYRQTSLGRDMWLKLIGSQGYLQPNCNKEGFNAIGAAKDNSKARIGILGNNENDCHTCDSRIGFGTGGYQDDSNTCGNHGNKKIKAMGYILVQ